MNQDLTKGPVMGSMLAFAVPMILGDLLQQCYNIADTLIVGRYLGKNALAAVGSSFTLMTFLTSILLGLCMGSGAVFSIRFGRRDGDGLREGAHAAFTLIAAITLALNLLAFACLDGIRVFLRVPGEVWPMMREYLAVIFCGIAATFLYNYFASFLRAVGNSVAPLVFLAASALAHVASAEAVCCVEAICGLNPAPVDYAAVPSCIFTTPEVASVGLTEAQAAEKGIAVRIGRFPFTASGKATAAGERDGFVKLIFDEQEKLLGAHLVGEGVTEMLGEPTLARKLGATAQAIAGTVHAHPTMNEGIMEAAEAALGHAIHL